MESIWNKKKTDDVKFRADAAWVFWAELKDLYVFVTLWIPSPKYYMAFLDMISGILHWSDISLNTTRDFVTELDLITVFDIVT